MRRRKVVEPALMKSDCAIGSAHIGVRPTHRASGDAPYIPHQNMYMQQKEVRHEAALFVDNTGGGGLCRSLRRG